MNNLIRYIVIGLLFSSFIGYSQSNTATDQTIQRLKKTDKISPAEIIQLNIIDQLFFQDAESVHCDTSILLSNNVFYTIISISDKWGVCSHLFILTIDETNKKAITSQYIESECNEPILPDTNNDETGTDKIFNYKIISNDLILLTVTKLHKEKVKTSNNEEKKIERKEIEETYFIIDQNGQIIKIGKEIEKATAKNGKQEENSVIRSEKFLLCDNSDPLLHADTYPEYIGGLKQLQKDMNSALRSNEKINGKIFLRLKINCNGKISEIKIEKAIYPDIYNIALMKQLMSLQNWKAGTVNKKSVNCETRITFPIVKGLIKFDNGTN